MPHRKQISELDRKIENLILTIEALRRGKVSPNEIDRALYDLARVKAERLRLMLRQVNLSAEWSPHPTVPEAGAVQSSNSDG
jgi:hypothetical protein